MTRIWNAYLAPACLCQLKLLKLNLSPRLWKWTKWKIRASVQLFATKLWNHRSDFTDLFLTCFHFWITLACLQQKLQSWFLKITKKSKKWEVPFHCCTCVEQGGKAPRKYQSSKRPGVNHIKATGFVIWSIPLPPSPSSLFRKGVWEEVVILTVTFLYKTF